ncbi:hypothetical protein JTB14_038370 [Gonioctena quinquepunctata]|nr:hypothetical protein JTB14_038370 [Gonioctena quinquepunctata]
MLGMERNEKKRPGKHNGMKGKERNEKGRNIIRRRRYDTWKMEEGKKLRKTWDEKMVYWEIIEKKKEGKKRQKKENEEHGL